MLVLILLGIVRKTLTYHMLSIIFLAKTIFLSLAVIVARGTLPRYRNDHFIQDS